MGKQYFLDCGANVGQSVQHYISTGIITPSTEVHLFEPNPACIAEAKSNLEQYNNYNFTFHEVALWDEDCQRRLTLEYTDDYDDQYGSGNVIKGKKWTGGASHIMGDEWNKPAYIPDENIKEGGLTDCIDFAHFLWETIEEDAEKVYLKMDIEGSEYVVLRHLVETETLKYITDIVDIEWHDFTIDASLDPRAYGIAMCRQVNDLTYEMKMAMGMHPRSTFEGHVNVSTTSCKFSYDLQLKWLIYTLSDEKLDLNEDGTVVPVPFGHDPRKWYFASSYSAVSDMFYAEYSREIDKAEGWSCEKNFASADGNRVITVEEPGREITTTLKR